jgi:hypothetical protein
MRPDQSYVNPLTLNKCFYNELTVKWYKIRVTAQVHQKMQFHDQVRPTRGCCLVHQVFKMNFNHKMLTYNIFNFLCLVIIHNTRLARAMFFIILCLTKNLTRLWSPYWIHTYTLNRLADKNNTRPLTK